MLVGSPRDIFQDSNKFGFLSIRTGGHSEYDPEIVGPDINTVHRFNLEYLVEVGDRTRRLDHAEDEDCVVRPFKILRAAIHDIGAQRPRAAVAHRMVAGAGREISRLLGAADHWADDAQRTDIKHPRYEGRVGIRDSD